MLGIQACSLNDRATQIRSNGLVASGEFRISQVVPNTSNGWRQSLRYFVQTLLS
jgi:hypothetical protein